MTDGGGRPSGPVRVTELFRVFFVMGLTAFGVAILPTLRSVPVRQGWLTREDVDEGLGLVQLYPGAVMVDLVAYIGYRTGRIRGALATTAGFITPALLLVLGLSWAYRTYGAVPGVTHLVTGLDAIVTGVVASAALDLAGQHARGKIQATLAVAAFTVAVAKVNVLWAVPGGLIAGAVALRPPTAQADSAAPAAPGVHRRVAAGGGRFVSMENHHNLLYRELPHVETTRPIARRFNDRYGLVFPEPLDSGASRGRRPSHGRDLAGTARQAAGAHAAGAHAAGRHRARPGGRRGVADMQVCRQHGPSARRLGLSLMPAAVVASGAVAAALAPGTLAAITADMAKIGAVAFGNGTTILPVLQQDVVTAHHWLSPQAFGAGIAIGQATPGPILIVAAFAGFQAAGWWGGILAGVAIFAPSVVITMPAAEAYPLLRRLTWVRGAIRGIMAAFTGLLGSVVLSIGHQIMGVPAALALAAAALAAVRVFKWNLLLVFGAGLAVWAVYLGAGGPVPA